MKVVLSPRAQRDLERQVQYLIDQDAARPARALKARVTGFLRSTLAKYPRIGLPIEHRDLYETWITRNAHRDLSHHADDDRSRALLACRAGSSKRLTGHSGRLV